MIFCRWIKARGSEEPRSSSGMLSGLGDLATSAPCRQRRLHLVARNLFPHIAKLVGLTRLDGVSHS